MPAGPGRPSPAQAWTWSLRGLSPKVTAISMCIQRPMFPGLLHENRVTDLGIHSRCVPGAVVWRSMAMKASGLAFSIREAKRGLSPKNREIQPALPLSRAS